jgi:hypothetical protein
MSSESGNSEPATEDEDQGVTSLSDTTVTPTN